MASAVTSPRPEGDSEYYGASTLEWQESQLQESHGYFKACALNQSISSHLHCCAEDHPGLLPPNLAWLCMVICSALQPSKVTVNAYMQSFIMTHQDHFDL